MKIYLLDTNVLLRYVVGDNQDQQKQAIEWFEQAEKRKIKIIVESTVIAEACFVLESFYKKSRPEVADVMIVFLSQRWLNIPSRKALLGMWKDYLAGDHFVDSFLLSQARVENSEILSFDRKLVKKMQAHY